ncbi:TPA: glycosyltransferase [Photobacterium damselae]
MDNVNNYHVTVIITTYNRVALLERAIESVLNQSFKNYELIISDDCSTDGTSYLCRKYTEQYSFIKYICNDKNSGANVSRNNALKIAQGKYITGLDDDDYFEKERLSVLLERFDESKYSFICANIKILYQKEIKNRFNDFDRELYKDDLAIENLAGNQILTLTSRLRKIGGFDVNLKRLQDMDTFYRLVLEFGPAIRIGDVLYVIDESHNYSRITKSQNEYDSYLSFYNKHKLDMSLYARLTNEIRLKAYGYNFKLSESYIKFLNSKINYIPALKVIVRRLLGRLK